MREIKFRVYSNYYKKYLDTSGKGIFCEVHHLALKPDGKIYYADIGIDYPGTLSECPTLDWAEDYYEDCVVEQDTGLKDKNGKEIYEGDIVEEEIDCGDDDVDGTYRYTVVWDEDTLCWSLSPQYGVIHKDLWETNSSVEVIGNIHETHESLKEKE